MLNRKRLRKKLAKAKSDPAEAFRFLLSLLRGKLFVCTTKMTAAEVQIGESLRLRSGIRIRGPGKVILGNNVTADLSFLRTPSIITHTREACVTIGDGTYLGGTRISCVTRVTIGKEGLFGSTTIIDSDIIPTRRMRIDSHWIEQHAAPVEIGDHFWAGTNAFILKGSKIGNECVLGAGATVYDKIIPDRSLLIGNPARKIGVTR